MAIHFDAANMTAGRVGGRHGLTASELAAGRSAALEALEAFHARVTAGDYGFPHLPFDRRTVHEILRYASRMRGSFDTVCVAGIGGSALGAWALDCALRGPHPVQPAFSKDNPRLVILDNVDPCFVLAALDSMNPRKTLVLVIAKSGATAETMAAFLILREWLEKSLGAARVRAKIAVVTSKGKGDLFALASKEGFETFFLPDNVGGRFSVLSAAGLLPAALCNMDIRKLCRGAAGMTSLCWKRDLEQNTALRAALFHWLTWTLKAKPVHVAFPYSNRLWGAAFWFRQLWAESLGKKFNRQGAAVHTGQTPVAALGATDQHSQVQLYREGPNDKLFTFWTVNKFANPVRIPKSRTGFEAMDYLGGQTLEKLLAAEQRATAAALREAERPNCRFTLDRMDENHLGAFLQLLEFETAFLGELLGIDAFDQPGVELAKWLTFALMGRKGYEQHLSMLA